jgi:CheY-like chemotaxis protein/HPt (histidine-containing phosphotransfer) domain-containing protein
VAPGAFDANADEGLHGEFSGASALLVEDHAINRRVAAHLLDYAGIDVAVATNGEEACAALLGPGARPVDIILMDVQMPGMDGLTATQKLRAAGIATPIVALTAGVSTEEREACFAAGMSDWLAKPIDTDDLAAVLTRWLPARRGPASPSPSRQPLAPTVAEASAVPGIDLEGALRRFLGKRDVFEQALGSFVRAQRPQVERIAALLAEGQSATLARLLHGLAGGAATLGANALQEAARALENAVRSGATDALPEAQRGLREAFDEVESLVAGGVGKPFS